MSSPGTGTAIPSGSVIRKVWGQFYNAADKIGFAHGYGTLRQQASQASHCTNIGRVHRRMIHPLFERWFGIQVAESDEYSSPRKPEELICLTEKARSELRPKSLTEVMSAIGLERIEAARRRLAGKSAAERRQLLRDDWSRLLGPVTPAAPPVIKSDVDGRPAGGRREGRTRRAGGRARHSWCRWSFSRQSKPRAERPPSSVWRRPERPDSYNNGPAELLKLLQHGVMVVLPDLRGTGESRSGSSRGRDSSATNLSVHVQLFGETLLGQRLRDLRSVLAYLRERRGRRSPAESRSGATRSHRRTRPTRTSRCRTAWTDGRGSQNRWAGCWRCSGRCSKTRSVPSTSPAD